MFCGNILTAKKILACLRPELGRHTVAVLAAVLAWDMSQYVL